MAILRGKYDQNLIPWEFFGFPQIFRPSPSGPGKLLVRNLRVKVHLETKASRRSCAESQGTRNLRGGGSHQSEDIQHDVV